MVDYGRLHVFQSTLPGWGATTRLTRSCIASFYFNPRSPDGERHGTCAPPSYFVENFNPRSPDGERPGVHERVGSARGISIHAPRMGSDAHEQRQHVPHVEISIHAPRMGSDSQLHHLIDCRAYFNPRSPDGERPRGLQRNHHRANFNPRSPDGERHTCPRHRRLRANFNPRSPDGERRCRTPPPCWWPSDFNPRSPDGERPCGTRRSWPTSEFQSTLPGWGATTVLIGACVGHAISIHAPRMGSDYTSDQIVHCKFLFQSTLPGWGATERARPTCRVSLISIHAPRMGSDVARHVHRGTGRNFNPRSPDGERPALRANSRKPCSNFNPRSPDGERLSKSTRRKAMTKFQSTLPGWGATTFDCRFSSWHQYFNPRSPDGERRTIHQPYITMLNISIHAPRMGSDNIPRQTQRPAAHFNPRSPDGERPDYRHPTRQVRYISIHAPRMGSDRENGHLRPRYGQNHPFSTLIVSQIVVDVLGTVRKSQKTPAH